MIWKNLINIFIFLLLFACQAYSYNPRQTVVNSLKLSSSSTMQSSSARSAILATPDSFVRYQVGNPNFSGRTTVEIQGNGSVTVEFKQGDKEEHYKGVLSPETLMQIKNTLQTNDPRDLKSSRLTGVPNEARIQFTVKDASNNEQVTELWDNEQWDNEALRSLVVTFTKVAQQISGGKVQY